MIILFDNKSDKYIKGENKMAEKKNNKGLGLQETRVVFRSEVS